MEWTEIHVDDDYPDAGTWVICATHIITYMAVKKRIARELFYDGKNEYGHHWLCDGDWPNKVTHWTPLPPLPHE